MSAISRAIAASAATSSIGATFAAASGTKCRSLRAPIRKARRAASSNQAGLHSRTNFGIGLGTKLSPLAIWSSFWPAGMLGILRTCFANRIFNSGRFGLPQTYLDQRIFDLQRISRVVVRQIRNLQMNGRDSRQALIVGVQGGSHGGEAGHQRINLPRYRGAGSECLPSLFDIVDREMRRPEAQVCRMGFALRNPSFKPNIARWVSRGGSWGRPLRAIAHPARERAIAGWLNPSYKCSVTPG